MQSRSPRDRGRSGRDTRPLVDRDIDKTTRSERRLEGSPRNVDVDKVLKAIDMLRKAFSGSPLPVDTVQRLSEKLQQLESDVIKNGRGVVDGAEIYENFWANWASFKRVFVKVNTDEETPRMIVFFQEQLSKAVNSVRIAEKVTGIRDDCIVELYGLFQEALTSLAEVGEKGTIRFAARDVRALYEFMSTTVAPLFEDTTTRRFLYAMQCVERAQESMMGLVATRKVHHQLQSDFDRAEERMRVLVPETLRTREAGRHRSGRGVSASNSGAVPERVSRSVREQLPRDGYSRHKSPTPMAKTQDLERNRWDERFSDSEVEVSRRRRTRRQDRASSDEERAHRRARNDSEGSNIRGRQADEMTGRRRRRLDASAPQITTRSPLAGEETTRGRSHRNVLDSPDTRQRRTHKEQFVDQEPSPGRPTNRQEIQPETEKNHRVPTESVTEPRRRRHKVDEQVELPAQNQPAERRKHHRDNTGLRTTQGDALGGDQRKRGQTEATVDLQKQSEDASSDLVTDGQRQESPRRKRRHGNIPTESESMGSVMEMHVPRKPQMLLAVDRDYTLLRPPTRSRVYKDVGTQAQDPEIEKKEEISQTTVSTLAGESPEEEHQQNPSDEIVSDDSPAVCEPTEVGTLKPALQVSAMDVVMDEAWGTEGSTEYETESTQFEFTAKTLVSIEPEDGAKPEQSSGLQLVTVEETFVDRSPTKRQKCEMAVSDALYTGTPTDNNIIDSGEDMVSTSGISDHAWQSADIKSDAEIVANTAASEQTSTVEPDDGMTKEGTGLPVETGEPKDIKQEIPVGIVVPEAVLSSIPIDTDSLSERPQLVPTIAELTKLTIVNLESSSSAKPDEAGKDDTIHVPIHGHGGFALESLNLLSHPVHMPEKSREEKPSQPELEMQTNTATEGDDIDSQTADEKVPLVGESETVSSPDAKQSRGYESSSSMIPAASDTVPAQDNPVEESGPEIDQASLETGWSEANWSSHTDVEPRKHRYSQRNVNIFSSSESAESEGEQLNSKVDEPQNVSESEVGAVQPTKLYSSSDSEILEPESNNTHDDGKQTEPRRRNTEEAMKGDTVEIYEEEEEEEEEETEEKAKSLESDSSWGLKTSQNRQVDYTESEIDVQRPPILEKAQMESDSCSTARDVERAQFRRSSLQSHPEVQSAAIEDSESEKTSNDSEKLTQVRHPELEFSSDSSWGLSMRKVMKLKQKGDPQNADNVPDAAPAELPKSNVPADDLQQKNEQQQHADLTQTHQPESSVTDSWPEEKISTPISNEENKLDTKPSEKSDEERISDEKKESIDLEDVGKHTKQEESDVDHPKRQDMELGEELLPVADADPSHKESDDEGNTHLAKPELSTSDAREDESRSGVDQVLDAQGEPKETVSDERNKVGDAQVEELVLPSKPSSNEVHEIMPDISSSHSAKNLAQESEPRPSESDDKGETETAGSHKDVVRDSSTSDSDEKPVVADKPHSDSLPVPEATIQPQVQARDITLESKEDSNSESEGHSSDVERATGISVELGQLGKVNDTHNHTEPVKTQNKETLEQHPSEDLSSDEMKPLPESGLVKRSPLHHYVDGTPDKRVALEKFDINFDSSDSSWGLSLRDSARRRTSAVSDADQKKFRRRTSSILECSSSSGDNPEVQIPAVGKMFEDWSSDNDSENQERKHAAEKRVKAKELASHQKGKMKSQAPAVSAEKKASSSIEMDKPTKRETSEKPHTPIVDTADVTVPLGTEQHKETPNDQKAISHRVISTSSESDQQPAVEVNSHARRDSKASKLATKGRSSSSEASPHEDRTTPKVGRKVRDESSDREDVPAEVPSRRRKDAKASRLSMKDTSSSSEASPHEHRPSPELGRKAQDESSDREEMHVEVPSRRKKDRKASRSSKRASSSSEEPPHEDRPSPELRRKARDESSSDHEAMPAEVPSPSRKDAKDSRSSPKNTSSSSDNEAVSRSVDNVDQYQGQIEVQDPGRMLSIDIPNLCSDELPASPNCEVADSVIVPKFPDRDDVLPAPVLDSADEVASQKPFSISDKLHQNSDDEVDIAYLKRRNVQLQHAVYATRESNKAKLQEVLRLLLEKSRRLARHEAKQRCKLAIANTELEIVNLCNPHAENYPIVCQALRDCRQEISTVSDNVQSVHASRYNQSINRERKSKKEELAKLKRERTKLAERVKAIRAPIKRLRHQYWDLKTHLPDYIYLRKELILKLKYLRKQAAIFDNLQIDEALSERPTVRRLDGKFLACTEEVFAWIEQLEEQIGEFMSHGKRCRMLVRYFAAVVADSIPATLYRIPLLSSVMIEKNALVESRYREFLREAAVSRKSLLASLDGSTEDSSEKHQYREISHKISRLMGNEPKHNNHGKEKLREKNKKLKRELESIEHKKKKLAMEQKRRMMSAYLEHFLNNQSQLSLERKRTKQAIELVRGEKMLVTQIATFGHEPLDQLDKDIAKLNVVVQKCVARSMTLSNGQYPSVPFVNEYLASIKRATHVLSQHYRSLRSLKTQLSTDAPQTDTVETLREELRMLKRMLPSYILRRKELVVEIKKMKKTQEKFEKMSIDESLKASPRVRELDGEELILDNQNRSYIQRLDEIEVQFSALAESYLSVMKRYASVISEVIPPASYHVPLVLGERFEDLSLTNELYKTFSVHLPNIIHECLSAVGEPTDGSPSLPECFERIHTLVDSLTIV